MNINLTFNYINAVKIGIFWCINQGVDWGVTKGEEEEEMNMRERNEIAVAKH